MREALNDPAIPLLDIYPEEIRIEKDTCTRMFTAALVTISRTALRDGVRRGVGGRIQEGGDTCMPMADSC